MQIFKKYPELLISISDKSFGNMKGTDKETVENKKTFFKSWRLNYKKAVFPFLEHRDRIRVIRSKDLGQSLKCDSLVTQEKNIFLTITVADCLPIFLYEPKAKIIALTHTGWRSLVKNILGKTVQKMHVLNASAQNIVAFIGPGIGPCHFEVKKDISFLFSDYPEAIKKRSGKIFLDLKKIALIQLIKSGLRPQNIEINRECTFCSKDDILPALKSGVSIPKEECPLASIHPRSKDRGILKVANKYFSHRRDGGKKVKAMIAIFGLQS